ncbi:MAG: GNAT family N-acetyltransferase [Dactylosporangium sp.]|nr:hypothetical protein [Dactylosporangium sp.]NNJ62352.1 GNAT family N-acetyltransferase [Dactylosporangium sp.]
MAAAASARTLPGIVGVTDDDVSPIAGMVAEALFPLRAAQWTIPDPERRQITIADTAAVLIEHALRHGHVDLLSDRSAVAVWFHHERSIPTPSDLDQRLETAFGRYADRLRAVRQVLATHRPTESHHHLALFAVRPDCQGTGRGTLLLRHHHQILDGCGMPSSTVVTGLRAANLCEREGYRPYTEPFGLPDENLCYPMWRIPGCRALSAFRPVALGKRRRGNAEPRLPASTGRTGQTAGNRDPVFPRQVVLAEPTAVAVLDETAVLRLQVEAALTVVPLVSRVVADRGDRRAVVVDVVDRWLALPVAVRQRYGQVAGSDAVAGSDGRGLERFGWDFVDSVERGMPPRPGGERSASVEGPMGNAEVAEQVVFERWCRYLESRSAIGNGEVGWAA